MRIAITGATGFVGRRLLAHLREREFAVRALVRPATSIDGVECAPWSLDDGGDPRVLDGVTALVHAAAYIPADHDKLAEAEACWRRNALATCRLRCLRLSAVYGPGMANAGMVPTFATRLLRGDTVVLDHGGRYEVDLVHVDDVVVAIAAALRMCARGAYNVGSGRAVTSFEVARTLAILAGRVPDEAIEVRSDRERADLGYAPRSAHDGLASMLESFRA